MNSRQLLDKRKGKRPFDFCTFWGVTKTISKLKTTKDAVDTLHISTADRPTGLQHLFDFREKPKNRKSKWNGNGSEALRPKHTWLSTRLAIRCASLEPI